MKFFLSLVLSLQVLTFVACKEEQTVVYNERIAILPDQSGYLAKEIRVLDKTHSEMVIVEVIGKLSKDIFTSPLTDYDDVKFRFSLRGDTIFLCHHQSKLDLMMRTLGKPTFATQMKYKTEVQWLSSGTSEGDPLFYDPGKWGAFLQLVQRP